MQAPGLAKRYNFFTKCVLKCVNMFLPFSDFDRPQHFSAPSLHRPSCYGSSFRNGNKNEPPPSHPQMMGFPNCYGLTAMGNNSYTFICVKTSTAMTMQA